jgi:ParB-like chromosome segregation protein Spo0J
MSDQESDLLVPGDQFPVEVLSVDSLKLGDSPRLSGENEDHARTLAQSGAPLPPILVHRPSMRVIDGAHRLLAAKLRGDTSIEARLFDGDDDEAFMLAVRANVAHGLPLTLADRTAAAIRILDRDPRRSDRTIGAMTGLAASTVAGIRQRSTVRSEQLNARVGSDGRVRPLNSAVGRRRVSALLEVKPDASMREIAREAGVSPATVHDVRRRLTRGEDPIPAGRDIRQRRESGEVQTRPPAEPGPKRDEGSDPLVILRNLHRDPSLRFTESGRALLVWMTAHCRDLDRWREYVDRVPPHGRIRVAELARRCGQAWNAFARELERDIAKGS